MGEHLKTKKSRQNFENITHCVCLNVLFLGKTIIRRNRRHAQLLISQHSDKDAVKFIYSEKATKVCEISTNYLSYELSYVLPVKYLVEILQNLVAFSEYMNFKVKVSLEPKF